MVRGERKKMNNDIFFGLVLLCGIICFFVGIAIGLHHNKKVDNGVMAVITHNATIATITAWLRENQDRIVADVMTRNKDLKTLPEIIANEIDKYCTHKTLK